MEATVKCEVEYEAGLNSRRRTVDQVQVDTMGLSTDGMRREPCPTCDLLGRVQSSFADLTVVCSRCCGFGYVWVATR